MAAVMRHMSGRFQWGVADCCVSACDIFRDLWGVDPMGDLRGAYGTGAEARSLISGGLTWVAMEMARKAELEPVYSLTPGAIGVLEDRKRPSALVICTGDRWAQKSLTGVGFVAGKAVYRAWCVK